MSLAVPVPNLGVRARWSTAPLSSRQQGRCITMAYLEITLHMDPANRAAAAGVYQQYKQPFLDTVPGATSKELLVRDEDVQVLHGFKNAADARAYLASELFTS